MVVFPGIGRTLSTECSQAELSKNEIWVPISVLSFGSWNSSLNPMCCPESFPAMESKNIDFSHLTTEKALIDAHMKGKFFLIH